MTDKFFNWLWGILPLHIPRWLEVALARFELWMRCINDEF